MVKNRIAVLRKEQGMNQKELGMKLGVGQTTVSAWETGKNEPDAESLHKMARLFRVSLHPIHSEQLGFRPKLPNLPGRHIVGMEHRFSCPSSAHCRCGQYWRLGILIW